MMPTARHLPAIALLLVGCAGPPDLPVDEAASETRPTAEGGEPAIEVSASRLTLPPSDPTEAPRRYALPETVVDPRGPIVAPPPPRVRPAGRPALDPAEARQAVHGFPRLLRAPRASDAAGPETDHGSDGWTAANSCNFVGSDTRVAFSGLPPSPYNRVVHLYATKGAITWGCSGVLIAKNFVLTAGHCVYTHEAPEGWAEQIVVVPGANGKLEPYGRVATDQFSSVKGWTSNEDHDYDIGLVRLTTAAGKSTGWMGTGVYSDADLRAWRLDTAGYPYDHGGATMVHDNRATKSVTAHLICSELGTCSGQSGSGCWESGLHVVGVISGHGGTCSPNSRVTRLTSDLFTWMTGVLGTCSCSSGACCDGCSFLDASAVCNGNVSVEYRCADSSCGADVQRRVRKQRCSGGSSSCGGALEWGSWETTLPCPSDSRCVASGTSSASCSPCPFGCRNGACCECSSGACCDGCRFVSSATECRAGVASERRCAGASCGAAIEERAQGQRCSGTTSSCDGALDWGAWKGVETCSTSSLCVAEGGAPRCSTCAMGCKDGSCCECSSGPCCDGCRFRPSTHVCDAAAGEEQDCESDLCGGRMRKRVAQRTCSGKSSACDQPPVPGAWQPATQCAATEVCRMYAGRPYCYECLGGCIDGRCKATPTLEGGCSCALGGSQATDEKLAIAVAALLLLGLARRRPARRRSS